MKYLQEKAWRTCEYYKSNSSQIGVIKNELSQNMAKRVTDKAGREFLDIPAVILGQQVLYGAGGYEFGAELVTEKALVRSANQWNNIPVVIYHTSESARTIENLENEKIGYIYNAEIIGYDEEPTNIRLKCMLRLDVALMMLHEEGEFIINTFDAGNIMEMSTGYYVMDWQWQEGTFRGRDYVAMQNEIIPDHLALLPNAGSSLRIVGAYSIEDGGGANRENEGEPMKDTDKKEVAEIFNELFDEKFKVIEERFKEVPTTDNISEMVGKVSEKVDGLVEQLTALNTKEEQEQEEDVTKNEANEALILKVMEKGFTREELNGVSEKILEHMAREEDEGFQIPHPDVENTGKSVMHNPDLVETSEKETE